MAKEKVYFMITEDELEALADYYAEKIHNITESWNDVTDGIEKKENDLKDASEGYIHVMEALEEVREKSRSAD